MFILFTPSLSLRHSFYPPSPSLFIPMSVTPALSSLLSIPFLFYLLTPFQLFVPSYSPSFFPHFPFFLCILYFLFCLSLPPISHPLLVSSHLPGSTFLLLVVPYLLFFHLPISMFLHPPRICSFLTIFPFHILSTLLFSFSTLSFALFFFFSFHLFLFPFLLPPSRLPFLSSPCIQRPISFTPFPPGTPPINVPRCPFKNLRFHGILLTCGSYFPFLAPFSVRFLFVFIYFFLPALYFLAGCCVSSFGLGSFISLSRFLCVYIFFVFFIYMFFFH